MSDTPILYSFWQSSCAWRVRIALAYKGIEYECREVNLYDNEQWDTKFAEINPVAFVPVLLHNGKCITESFAILEYLEEAFPNTPKLLPEDLHQRFRCSLSPVSNLCKMSVRLPTMHLEIEKRKLICPNHFINLGFRSLDKRLKATVGKHAVGDQLTFADVCVVPQVYNGVVAYAGVNLDEYPTIKRVFESAIKLDAFWNSHPYHQSGAPETLEIEDLKSKGFLLEKWADRRNQHTAGHSYKSQE
ncbi:putative maleylacetoacetate isomerase 2 isoform X2 [Aphelenchoides bicaudatus]|nr:putative maleylacetoacetate isomerase 2 isoform X2 [Aphelenchoides bicaudatus]